MIDPKIYVWLAIRAARIAVCFNSDDGAWNALSSETDRVSGDMGPEVLREAKAISDVLQSVEAFASGARFARYPRLSDR